MLVASLVEVEEGSSASLGVFPALWAVGCGMWGCVYTAVYRKWHIHKWQTQHMASKHVDAERTQAGGCSARTRWILLVDY